MTRPEKSITGTSPGYASTDSGWCPTFALREVDAALLLAGVRDLVDPPRIQTVSPRPPCSRPSAGSRRRRHRAAFESCRSSRRNTRRRRALPAVASTAAVASENRYLKAHGTPPHVCRRGPRNFTGSARGRGLYCTGGGGGGGGGGGAGGGGGTGRWVRSRRHGRGTGVEGGGVDGSPGGGTGGGVGCLSSAARHAADRRTGTRALRLRRHRLVLQPLGNGLLGSESSPRCDARAAAGAPPGCRPRRRPRPRCPRPCRRERHPRRCPRRRPRRRRRRRRPRRRCSRARAPRGSGEVSGPPPTYMGRGPMRLQVSVSLATAAVLATAGAPAPPSITSRRPAAIRTRADGGAVRDPAEGREHGGRRGHGLDPRRDLQITTPASSSAGRQTSRRAERRTPTGSSTGVPGRGPRDRLSRAWSSRPAATRTGST